MEISLEKIELVKDRTGVNYKEAKEALIKADGSVVDAIIMIEDEIDLVPKSKAGDQASQLIERLKKLIKKGNVSRIVVKRDEQVLLNVPVNIGIVGAVWVFWPTVVATVVALGMKCSIELVKDNGEIVNLSDRAADTFGGVRENCSIIADDLRGKGGEAFSQVRDKAANVINKAKPSDDEEDDDDYDYDEDIIIREYSSYDEDDSEPESDLDDDSYDDDYFNFDDYEEPENTVEKSAAEPVKSTAADGADADEADDEVISDIQKAGEKFEETIADYKKKKGKFKFFD